MSESYVKSCHLGWVEATIGDLTMDKSTKQSRTSDSLVTYVDISGIDMNSNR